MGPHFGEGQYGTMLGDAAVKPPWGKAGAAIDTGATGQVARRIERSSSMALAAADTFMAT